MKSPRVTARRGPGGPEHPLDRLNRAELKVLQQLSMDASNGEIAQKLSVPEQTVQNHVSQILHKLELADRQDAARLARRQGLRAA
ncbi:MAG: response regulator transcription factor [Nitrososphaerales archaeon]